VLSHKRHDTNINHGTKTIVQRYFKVLMALHLFNKLSNRLFFAVLATSLTLGACISFYQVFLDSRSTYATLHQDTKNLLSIAKEPATTAVLNADKNKAQNIINDLFKYNFILSASIENPEGPIASRSREAEENVSRKIGALLLGSNHEYTLQLYGLPDTQKIVGTLIITLDPAYTIDAFMVRSFQFISNGLLQSILFGIVIYLIFHFMITRPMRMVTSSLASIDPLQPGRTHLPIPKGHASNEIGSWVTKINDLFATIEKHHQAQRVAQEHITRLSNYDMLTELPNRTLLNARIEQAILTANNKRNKFCLLLCNLDDFDAVNLLHSYHCGDQLLLSLAKRFQGEIPSAHTVSRIGGDIFTLIVPNINTPADAAKAAEETLKTIRQPFLINGSQITVTASIGITLFPHDGSTPDALLKRAENVMQLAKAQGGDRYQFYVESIDQQIEHSKRLEKSLPEALRQEQFSLVFQPQIDLKTLKICGAEALIRWNHPEKGLIPPTDFIHLAENNQIIIDIGEWIIKEACRTLSEWHKAGYGFMDIAINVSSIQLLHSNLYTLLDHTLKSFNLPASAITLEITETAIMSNLEAAIKTLWHIKESGIQIAIDDFGTGYASLNHLKRLPFDKIKIDKSFLDDMQAGSESTKIISAVIQLGHSLNMKLIAEGAETIEQINILKQCHCDYAQGYYYSRPVNSQELKILLRKNNVLPIV